MGYRPWRRWIDRKYPIAVFDDVESVLPGGGDGDGREEDEDPSRSPTTASDERRSASPDDGLKGRAEVSHMEATGS